MSGQESKQDSTIGVHGGEKMNKCCMCNKIFIQKCSLRVHMRIHTGEKPYDCVVCGKRFHRQDNLVKPLEDSHRRDTL